MSAELMRHFWVEGEVVSLPRGNWPGSEDMIRLNVPCVDELYAADEAPEYRYGIYEHVNKWVTTPLTSFPKEFRAHLLLLGVT